MFLLYFLVILLVSVVCVIVVCIFGFIRLIINFFWFRRLHRIYREYCTWAYSKPMDLVFIKIILLFIRGLYRWFKRRIWDRYPRYVKEYFVDTGYLEEEGGLAEGRLKNFVEQIALFWDIFLTLIGKLLAFLPAKWPGDDLYTIGSKVASCFLYFFLCIVFFCSELLASCIRFFVLSVSHKIPFAKSIWFYFIKVLLFFIIAFNLVRKAPRSFVWLFFLKGLWHRFVGFFRLLNLFCRIFWKILLVYVQFLFRELLVRSFKLKKKKQDNNG